MRRVDAIELTSIRRTVKLSSMAEMKIEAKARTFICADASLNFHDSVKRIAFEVVSVNDKKESEGSLNRYLYLPERASVE